MILACLLGGEILLATLLFDGATAGQRTGLRGLLGQWGAWALRWAVGFAGLFCTFAYLRHQQPLAALTTQEPIRPSPLGAHALLYAAFLAVSAQVYGQGDFGDAGILLWVALAAGVALSGAVALIPPAVWRELRRITGSLWLLSAGAAALACAAAPLVQGLWLPATRITFWLVRSLLTPLVADLYAQPEQFILGTTAFRVIISPECSGLEGLGLLLVFGVFWLLIFREELRFPQALLLVPAGMIALYLSNSLRIAALLLIGNAGWPDVAARGFHSQAGWISFNLVAFGLSLGARRVAWFSRTPATAPATRDEFSAAPYLMPLLAILAAGMLAGALSGGFEWFYGLRVLACAGALWHFRRHYTQIDWRCGWLGPAVGVAVFAMWLWSADGPAQAMPAALESAGQAAGLGWLVLRVIGGTVTVPIAEELAFRGFGLRRLIEPDFERVPWQAFSWSSLLISSLLFGALHGHRWLAGTLAGVAYALALRWRGRLGDAIAAHGVTNALLAFWVLKFHRWDLW